MSKSHSKERTFVKDETSKDLTLLSQSYRYLWASIHVEGSTIILNIVRWRTVIHWSIVVWSLFPSLKLDCETDIAEMSITNEG